MAKYEMIIEISEFLPHIIRQLTLLPLIFDEGFQEIMRCILPFRTHTTTRRPSACRER